MKQVLVTGGAGFIGAHLVSALLGRGEAVRVIDNFVAGTAANLALAAGVPVEEVHRALAARSGPARIGERCQVWAADIRDPAAAAAACAGVEVIFHQAALRSVPRSLTDPVGTHEVNASGTLALLEVARTAGVPRFVFASSSSVYGETDLPQHEGQVPHPKSPYAASKLAAEGYGAAYSQAFGVSTVGLRYFNVFGPWQDPASEYAAVIPKFIRMTMRGEPLPVHGDGLQSRDFTYVDNVVDANLLAAGADAGKAGGRVLNIGAGERHTLLELIDQLGRILGRVPQIAHGPPRAGDMRHTQADISLAGRLIGYAPRVDFATGLRRTIEAMRGAEGAAVDRA